ncbi:hypothetical protein H2198_008001 [Neophaeococcomyces mojaviensis]|uniref:Uncharacterized protein n=1 Tax=Neophaeococcomyces mojaviensis TaxID=3383035 RepID=A0ACC2ZZ74_9EURO|nr:hypothetical protein H2198_008001 [Knufia sp. JES_112]
MDKSQEDSQKTQVNLYPQKRRKPADEMEIDTSPYFKLSRRTTETDESQSQASQQNSTSKTRERQGVLSFSDGKLLTKKPLVNPIGRDDSRRKSLKEVAEETWTLLPGLLATRPDVTNDSFLCRKETLDPARCPKLKATRVQVIDSDTIDAALSLTQCSAKPVAVLNMANAQHAGGGWAHGAMAQEEAICYRSSLAKTLHRKHYPIPEDAAIYSPTVMIIRESMKDGHELLDFRDPSQLDVISVISCAAICQPFLKKDAHGYPTYRNQKDAQLMLEKMRVILRTAIRNRHRQVILGALGCGAFANPNQAVADMWLTVLQEVEFQGGYWKDLIFAVLDGKKDDNFGVFHDTLDGLVV